MIDRPAVALWRVQHPWKTSAQVEQDLLICRCLVEIFRDEFLASQLAFRGGTAMHKREVIAKLPPKRQNAASESEERKRGVALHAELAR